MIEFRASRDFRSARTAFEGLEPGVGLYGFTDGSWSLVDAVRELHARAGADPSLVLAAWTVARREGQKLQPIARRCASFRLLVDRSYAKREPVASAAVRGMFGDAAIRVWSAHCKFAVVKGPEQCLVLNSSANLNTTGGIESFQVVSSAQVADDYLALVDRLWEHQAARQGFSDPRAGRRLSAAAARAWNPPKSDTADTLNIIDIGVDIDLGDFG